MFLYDGIKNDENSSKSDYYHSVTSEYLKNRHSYNADKTDISVGSADDITDEDRIFITLKEGIANEIFVWKNK